MGIELGLTLAVLAGAIYLFVTEKLPVDVVALLVLCCLLMLRIVSVPDALSGFSSPATVTVAAMFVLSAAIERSGALLGIAELLARVKWRWLFALLMMLLVASISAFVNNTAAVAVFLPLVIRATAARGWGPSRFLIPLSYAAQFGGVCTLVGTSTNLLVDSLARQSGWGGFSIFEFAPLGLIFASVGVLYMMIARPLLLPDLGVPGQVTHDPVGRCVAELLVMPGSRLADRRWSQLSVEGADPRAVLLEVFRGGHALPGPANVVLEPGDRLLVAGNWAEIETLRQRQRLRYDPVSSDLDGHPSTERLRAQVMITPGSFLIGKTLRDVRFGHLYRCRVHGLHRRQHSVMRAPINGIPLAVGDVLIVDATAEAIDTLGRDRGLIVLGARPQPRVDWPRAAGAIGVLVAVMLAAALGLLPIVGAALIGCAAVVALRCITPAEAYAAIDWRVVVLLAGLLPLGLAIDNTGGADWVAARTIEWVGPYGPVLTLAAVYGLTAMLTEIMSNNAAAVLVVPVAIAAAEGLGIDARPLLVAVAFAASTSFATPVGYQTNTMVYSAGGYRFTDFARIGIPLNLLFWGMAIVLIPRFFPF
jgi:di/tricarboxylate transporter